MNIFLNLDPIPEFIPEANTESREDFLQDFEIWAGDRSYNDAQKKLFFKKCLPSRKGQIWWQSRKMLFYDDSISWVKIKEEFMCIWVANELDELHIWSIVQNCQKEDESTLQYIQIMISKLRKCVPNFKDKEWVDIIIENMRFEPKLFLLLRGRPQTYHRLEELILEFEEEGIQELLGSFISQQQYQHMRLKILKLEKRLKETETGGAKSLKQSGSWRASTKLYVTNRDFDISLPDSKVDKESEICQKTACGNSQLSVCQEKREGIVSGYEMDGDCGAELGIQQVAPAVQDGITHLEVVQDGVCVNAMRKHDAVQYDDEPGSARVLKELKFAPTNQADVDNNDTFDCTGIPEGEGFNNFIDCEVITTKDKFLHVLQNGIGTDGLANQNLPDDVEKFHDCFNNLEDIQFEDDAKCDRFAKLSKRDVWNEQIAIEADPKQMPQHINIQHMLIFFISRFID